MIRRRVRLLSRWCFAALACLVLFGQVQAQDATGQPLLLDGSTETVDVWPAVRVRFDDTRALSLADVLADPSAFKAPASNYPTLGVRKDALWLRFPVELRCERRPCPWILDIDYAALAYVDTWLLVDGQVVQHDELGTLRPSANRPLASRSHSIVMNLQRDRVQEVLVRVETTGAMILPITLKSPQAFHGGALREQMLQGLLCGLGVCLLLYSLAQGIGLREVLFLKYALMISGSMLFSLLQFGIGAQFLWTDLPWVEAHVGPFAALVASTGSFLFIEQVLAGPESSRAFSRIMKGGSLLSACLAVGYLAGLVDTRAVSAIVSILGLVPVLMGIPGAVARARRRDPVGISFLVAWAVYFFATALMIAIINGRAPVNFWTLHSFQFGATLDMLLFMRVLGLRMKAIHAQARHATQERDAMRSLAHTDPLTGLPNRRGLNASLSAALARPGPNHRVAVYMLDLDGFKPVNDRHGHDVGDELLIAVAHRLRGSMRRGDVVARLGGDEFVVMTDQLQTDDEAQRIGENLLAAFAQPFELGHVSCPVGMTIGYALSPADATDAVSLLKQADAAMYVGKASGKGCVRRGGPARSGEGPGPRDDVAWSGGAG